jgi:hypothetical protein
LQKAISSYQSSPPSSKAGTAQKGRVPKYNLKNLNVINHHDENERIQ